MDLFDNRQISKEPLAARMRPRTLDEYIGQEHIVGKGRLLRRAIAADQLTSVIFYGPPGTGKTTLARVIANHTKSNFITLNAVLTVEDGKPACHAKKGWEVLTDSLLTAAASDCAPKVFMLWGNYAQSKEKLIKSCNGNHLVLTANHPSPLSALRPPVPFIGCGHFSKANDWLKAHQQKPIDWSRFSNSESEQLSLSF